MIEAIGEFKLIFFLKEEKRIAMPILWCGQAEYLNHTIVNVNDDMIL